MSWKEHFSSTSSRRIHWWPRSGLKRGFRTRNEIELAFESSLRFSPGNNFMKYMMHAYGWIIKFIDKGKFFLFRRGTGSRTPIDNWSMAIGSWFEKKNKKFRFEHSFNSQSTLVNHKWKAKFGENIT